MIGKLIAAFLSTFVIMFFVPLIPYGALSVLTGLEPPGGSDSASSFVVGVIVMKVGVAFGFVAIFCLARDSLREHWLAYAGAWWVMYAVVEVGQAIAPGYSWQEAGAGIVAEAIYFPASAWTVKRLLRTDSMSR